MNNRLTIISYIENEKILRLIFVKWSNKWLMLIIIVEWMFRIVAKKKRCSLDESSKRVSMMIKVPVYR